MEGVEANQILLATTAFISASFAKAKNDPCIRLQTSILKPMKPTKKSGGSIKCFYQKKWVNNLTVYLMFLKRAPKGKVFISVSFNGISTVDDATLAENMRRIETMVWRKVNSWKMLKAYRIEYALPTQESVRNTIDNEIKNIRYAIYLWRQLAKWFYQCPKKQED
jgi:hypothetical protein